MDFSKFKKQVTGLLQNATSVAEKTTEVMGGVDTTSVKDTISSTMNTLAGLKAAGEPIEEVEAEEIENYAPEKETALAEQDDKGSKMLQIMDWAFDKANGSIPGFGTSQEMAQKYIDKYGSVNAAIDHLVNWQITSAATAGFVTSLGGLATMPITLPANVAGVMAIQLRMIGAIAELGGFHENSEEKKTGMYLCLLGSQANNVLAQTTSQFTVKFATASLKKLPGTMLTKINQRVGFRLFSKFGEKGLVNLHKAIPVLGGIIGGTVDAFSTYAIAKAAKALFLNEIIEFEKQEQLEIAKIHLLINLARIDNDYAEDEKMIIRTIANGLNISDKSRTLLMNDIEHPKKFTVDMEPFKEDYMLYSSTLSALVQVAAIGGISSVEQMYINQLGQEMNCDTATIQQILQSAITDTSKFSAIKSRVAKFFG